MAQLRNTLSKYRILTILIGTAGIFFLTCLPATGQDQNTSKDLASSSLEQLMKIKIQSVYGASRYMQKVTQAPASITIVTSEEIRRYGYRTLGDILRSVPGFYVSYDRNYTYAAVRGFGRTGDYNSRILVLIDGHRENDDIYDGADLGNVLPVDIALIDRVEVIHGPSSSIYGSNAFFAVINIITKAAPTTSTSRLQVAIDGASYDTGRARITYGRKFPKGWDALLSSTLYDSHGPQRLFFREFDSPETNLGIAQDADSEKFGQFFAKISHKGLRLETVYGSREKGIPTASFGTVFNDSRARTTDRRGYVDLAFDHMFQRGFDVSSHVFFDSYTYDGIYPYNYSPETGSQVTLNYDYADGKWWGEDVEVSKQLFSRNRLIFGNAFRDNFRETQGNYDIAPYFLYLNDHHSSTLWAGYVQDEYTIRKNLLLNAGIRHDQYSTFGGTTNPRIGLIYNPFAKTTFKLLYGTAFRAPNAYELYYILSDYSSRNPSLGPESIRSAEFVAEQYIGDRYRLSASIFQNRIRNLIDQVTLPDGLLEFQNVGSVRAQGTELMFERKWTSGLAAQCNYTYEHAIESELGTRSELDNVPASLANLNVLVPLLPKRPRDFTLGIDLHYVSPARTLSGNHAAGFVLLNATLFARRLFKGLALSGSIYNLLDSHYGYPGGTEHREDIIYQNGRNARLSLVYTIGGGPG